MKTAYQQETFMPCYLVEKTGAQKGRWGVSYVSDKNSFRVSTFPQIMSSGIVSLQIKLGHSADVHRALFPF